VKSSQTLPLTCVGSGYLIITCGSSWNWIQQPQGKGLEWIAKRNNGGGISYNPSLKSFMSISRDTTKSQFSLQLSSVAAEDHNCIPV
jgi:hypothetical protein